MVAKNEAMRSRQVVNPSDHELSLSEPAVWQKRPQFSPTPKLIPNVNIIAAIEPVFGDVKDTVYAKVTRAKIGSILRRAERPMANVPKEESHAVNSLLSNEAIIIAPAVQGNTAVVQNASDLDLKARKASEEAIRVSEEEEPMEEGGRRD